MYRITEEEVRASQAVYKKNYKPFIPFQPSNSAKVHLGADLLNVLKTQNGQDTDDYSIHDGNKVERYLSGLTPGSKVLLLGTGTGRELLVAKDMGFDVWGTTFGSRNIDYAVDYLNISRDRILECPNEHLPFARETFDCVAAFQVFEHTMAPLMFLLEQGRVLKTGGTLLLEWPPPATHTGGANPHHQVCFTPGQAEALFQKAGFANIQLFFDSLAPIPESELWRGDQTHNLVIKGIKVPTSQEYIRTAWSRA